MLGRKKERYCTCFFLGVGADVPGPVPLKMVKFNPGLSQILNPVFLSKNMSFKLTKYYCVFNSRYSDDNTECYSKQCMGR